MEIQKGRFYNYKQLVEIATYIRERYNVVVYGTTFGRQGCYGCKITDWAYVNGLIYKNKDI